MSRRLEGAPLHLQWCKSSGDELPKLLFFWDNLHCPFGFEGSLCHIWYSLLAVFFSFRTLNISHPSSAALKVSAENSADTLTEGSLCVASHSFLDAFKTQ